VQATGELLISQQLLLGHDHRNRGNGTGPGSDLMAFSLQQNVMREHSPCPAKAFVVPVPRIEEVWFWFPPWCSRWLLPVFMNSKCAVELNNQHRQIDRSKETQADRWIDGWVGVLDRIANRGSRSTNVQGQGKRERKTNHCGKPLSPS